MMRWGCSGVSMSFVGSLVMCGGFCGSLFCIICGWIG